MKRLRALAIGMILFIPPLTTDTALAAQATSWAGIKATSGSFNPQPARRVVTPNRVAGTEELQLQLVLDKLADGRIEVSAVVSHLAGRTIAGWDVWVSYNPDRLSPAEFKAWGEVTGSQEDNYGLGGFYVADNPSDGIWKVSAASVFGTRREGSIFSLVFEHLGDVPITEMEARISRVLVFNEVPARYSVARMPNRFVEDK